MNTGVSSFTEKDLAALDTFRKVIEQVGLTPPEEIVADGQLHRFSSNGDRGDDAGWYVLFADGVPAGSFGCWRLRIKQNWCERDDQHLSSAERARHRARMESARQQRDAEEAHRHAEAAARAQTIWNEAIPAPNNHRYLAKKRIRSYGLRQDTEGRLLIPVLIGGTIVSLQRIAADGSKRFLHHGEVKGGSYALGDLSERKVILLCEGFATAASLHEATGHPTVLAFTASNLIAVAEQLRQQFPAATIMVCGDNDLRDDGTPNTGLAAAAAAADATHGLLVMPELDGTKCDFNDLAIAKGIDAVQSAIAAAFHTTPQLLNELDDFLGRFVSYPSEHAHVAHTLWVAHTHLMEQWESTPRLAFLSPEPGSGKSRALEVTSTLVPRPMQSINATAAALFRKVSDEAGPPTILYDEIDTIFGPKAKEHEDIRALINAGHRRGASAHRCVVRGKQIELEEFPAYCAVAMAGLGQLPDTILTRSIVIPMRRRAPHESVEPYRVRIHEPQGHRLRDQIAAWAKAIAAHLSSDPPMPPEITDRAADVWEALLSIADAAGGSWPERARVAAVTLVTRSMGGEGSLGVRLLHDLRTVFGDRPSMATTDVLDTLIGLDESPWGDLKGKPLDGRRLARFLKAYEISPKLIRIGGDVFRGYERNDLQDAWQRYLPPVVESPLGPSPIVHVTPVTKVTEPNGELLIED